MTEPVSNKAISENLNEHPAVDAWLAMDSTHRMPTNVTALYAAKLAHRKKKNRRKSAVYRLEGVGPNGASIVAKRCSSSSAAIERSIYEHILPELSISSLQYHGCAAMGDSHWLFLEYAKGVEWRVNDPNHIELAIQWLAKMHGTSAQLDALSALPNRGPRYYLAQLTTAQQRIQESLSNPALGPDDIEILDEFLACSGFLEPYWQEIEAFCETMPEALIHNDFAQKNVHVRATKAGAVLLAFDWEMSGKGVPATDLFWMFESAPDKTITRYWQVLREFNTNIARQDVEYLAVLGAIFRVLDAVEWASTHFSTHSPGRGIIYTERYTDRLKRAYHALGWL